MKSKISICQNDVTDNLMQYNPAPATSTSPNSAKITEKKFKVRNLENIKVPIHACK